MLVSSVQNSHSTLVCNTRGLSWQAIKHFKYLVNDWMNEQFLYWYFYLLHPLMIPIQTSCGRLPAWEWSPMNGEGRWPFSSLLWFKFLLLPSFRPFRMLWPYHPFTQTFFLNSLPLPMLLALITSALRAWWSSIWLSVPSSNWASVFGVGPECLPPQLLPSRRNGPQFTGVLDHHTCFTGHTYISHRQWGS